MAVKHGQGRGTFVSAAPYTSDTYKSLQTYGEDYGPGRTSRKCSFPERVGSYLIGGDAILKVVLILIPTKRKHHPNNG